MIVQRRCEPPRGICREAESPTGISKQQTVDGRPLTVSVPAVADRRSFYSLNIFAGLDGDRLEAGHANQARRSAFWFREEFAQRIVN